MKNRIWILLVLQCILIIFSGCAVNNFFDVDSTMSPPRVTKEESEIESTVKDYLGQEVKFCQLLVGGRYLSAVRYNFNGEEYIAVFCKVEDEELKSHIILLQRQTEGFAIKDDIVCPNIEFCSARMIHANSEEFGELIVEGVDSVTKKPVVYSWSIQSNGTIQIIE